MWPLVATGLPTDVLKETLIGPGTWGCQGWRVAVSTAPSHHGIGRQIAPWHGQIRGRPGDPKQSEELGIGLEAEDWQIASIHKHPEAA